MQKSLSHFILKITILTATTTSVAGFSLRAPNVGGLGTNRALPLAIRSPPTPSISTSLNLNSNNREELLDSLASAVTYRNWVDFVAAFVALQCLTSVVTGDCFPPLFSQPAIVMPSKSQTAMHSDSNRGIDLSQSDYVSQLKATVTPESVQSLHKEAEVELQTHSENSKSVGWTPTKLLVFGFIHAKFRKGFAFSIMRVKHRLEKTRPIFKITSEALEDAVGIFSRFLFLWSLQFGALCLGTGVFEPGVALSGLKQFLIMADFVLMVVSCNKKWRNLSQEQSSSASSSLPSGAEIQPNGFRTYDGSFPVYTES
eukprot:CAMPEP_0116139620 /NCGR_PEP_ID=MMETSP0329-20121206/13408_1 /TAXON_ID=697910 /ORGANISM="Pseudo-nitzschia arenysensis, Strain B593" /LENGTH=312 /DNA_ID=CAMNT_0003634673 /DNA_START=67 /DNA_END=1005 /DNA_ORIENTATION=-